MTKTSWTPCHECGWINNEHKPDCSRHKDAPRTMLGIKAIQDTLPQWWNDSSYPDEFNNAPAGRREAARCNHRRGPARNADCSSRLGQIAHVAV